MSDESPISRRALITSAGVAATGAVLSQVLGAQQKQAGSTPTATPSPTAPDDPSIVQGLPTQATEPRAQFEHPSLAPTGVTTGSSYSPLQDLTGTITPSDLHFQRNHNGIP